MDISDDPMDTKVQAAPPNIMFILDNSGSMDWEFMTTESDGVFSGNEYLFPNPGDNVYSASDSNGTILSSSNRDLWKSQWSGYNKIYYSPHSIYTPWPATSTHNLGNASLQTPYSNPIHSSSGDPSITLKTTFVTIGAPAKQVIVDNEEATLAGSWSESGFEPEWAYTDTIKTSKYTNQTGNTATFTPDIPDTGDYIVYVWWNCYTQRDANAEITINYNGGSEVKYFNQASAENNVVQPGVCGEWIPVGTYNFVNTDTGNVVIKRHAGSTAGTSTVADAVKFESVAHVGTDIPIANAHYYTWWDENGNGTLDNREIYLVTWEDTNADNILDHRLFFRLDDSSSDNEVDAKELKPLVYYENNQANDEVPDAVQAKIYNEDGVTYRFKTDEEDLQNFANWYSYYRRRELAAKAAVAKSVKDLDWVHAGFYTINAGVRQQVLPINVKSDWAIEDTSFIVVDNKDSGFTVSGSWPESGAESYGQEYNNSSLYSYTGTARWTPHLPTAGTYNVYAWWGYAGSRTDQAQYKIHHSTGDATVTKNHNIQTDAYKWQLLGTYTFDAGSTGYVEVRNAGSTSRVASADAIKFVSTSTASITVDQTDTLLDLLYSINSTGGTPLRSALKSVGQYYHQDDGYSGITGATNPFKSEAEGGACQQAFSILMTDGYYNGTSPSVGNVDGSKGAPFADSYSDTLADVAMKYYEEDLSSSLPNHLPTNNYDNNKNQHMVTYSVSFGVTGTIDHTDINNDSITDNPLYTDDPYFLNPNTLRPTWPNPGSGNKQKIDDLWHAAVNGRGQFFSADNPEELVSSLNSVFENLASRIASGASVSVNGDELNTGSVMYQSTYTSGVWEGDVTAYPINPTTGEILTQAGDILWKASEKLQTQDWNTGRRIVTYNGYNSIVPFRYANLTLIQKAYLENDSNTIDHLRGKEISGYRPRDRKLGDIVHSAPLLVIGDGMDNNSTGGTDEDGEENGIIFSGGNDGMLHAFDAITGNEIFAYVPHLIYDHLVDLTKVDYDHKFYIDATPYSRTITINTDKKVLVAGGLKKGGKGYYCLDVTKILYQDDGASLIEDNVATPAHADGVDVLWEYPALTEGPDTTFGTADDVLAVDADLGYSFSDIFIVQKETDVTDPTNHNWIAIFGNGYDSDNGKAVLYILNAYTGELIKKIDTGIAGNNGLSSPAIIDIDNDGRVDYVYAGDLLGNMWKFDLTSGDPDDWEVAYKNTDLTPAPLFSAPNQPITSAPDVMNHCAVNSGYMVLFGTGKFIGETDRSNIDKQSIYGIWDTGFPLGTWNSTNGTLSKIPGATLLEQSEIDNQYLYNHYLRFVSDNTATWVDIDPATGFLTSGTDIGWYFDLPLDKDDNGVLDGERVIKDVIIRNKTLIVITFTPSSSPCTGGGTSIVHELDPCDGSRLSSPQFDVNQDGIVDNRDLVEVTLADGSKIFIPPSGIGYDGLLHPPIILSMPDGRTEMKIFSSSAGTTQRLFEKASGGFYYWREIKN
ncbi:MAG: hypothetical protein KKD32_03875 [Proteobacteria bacterium]|nr:hypothetical protein [Pseudomonadota bacterium]MBU1386971.1 hypothetical protein [Pseudomonadota bacterium]